MKILPMTTDDLDEVMRIEEESFSFPWKREYFLYDLSRAGASCLVAKNDNLLGYIIAWEIDEELHIANIAVASQHRRKGIGSKLLAEIIRRSKDSPVKKIFLEVRVSNTIAQAFYKKFGFKYLYTRKNYYHDGEDAMVFSKTLSSNNPRH